MSNYKIEDFVPLCALAYFDIHEYQNGMSFESYVKDCLKETDNMSVFFKNLKDFIKQQDLTCFKQLIITDYYNDNQTTGLVYICFEDEENKYYVYRGSELYDPILYVNGWQDWMDNFEIFLGATHQQLKAYELFKKIKKDKPISLIGHSKGGNLVLFLGVVCNSFTQSKIKQILAFNAPQMNETILKTYKNRIQNQEFLDKVICIENQIDPISSMFHSIRKPIIVKSKYIKENISNAYESHQIWGYEMQDGRFIQVQKKGNLPIVLNKIVNQFMDKVSDKNKKRIIHQIIEICKDRKNAEMIQKKIESWVNQVEENK